MRAACAVVARRSSAAATLSLVRSDERNSMSSTTEPDHLSGHHRDTLLEIFQHPTKHNIEWHDVVSLLDEVGSVERRHDGKYLVRVGDETEVFTRPKEKDIDVQQVVDLRRMLTGAGYASVVAELEDKGKEV
jgi:hypothetical protein